jgi:hypothetical protein
MSEEPSNVAKSVSFVAMDSCVVCCKCLFETFCPHAIEFAETFADEAVECRVRPLLRTTLDDHVDHFDLSESSEFYQGTRKKGYEPPDPLAAELSIACGPLLRSSRHS